MLYRYFVGIDVSKSWFDVAVFDQKVHSSRQKLPTQRFDNDEKGYKAFKTHLAKDLGIRNFDSMFICLEHTGLYGIGLCLYFENQAFNYSLEAGAEISNSLGIKRGKNDKIDAKRIAIYAFKNRDDLPQHRLSAETIRQLKVLNTTRSRLQKNHHGHTVALKEQQQFDNIEGIALAVKIMKEEIKRIKEQMQEIEKEMLKVVKNDPDMKHIFDLITTVPGIGPITALYLIIYTENFTRFGNARQFASYCGIAPFENTSGSSIRGKTKVSHYANKRLKAILCMGARSVVTHCAEMHLYYQRRQKKGKTHFDILNAVKNKMIHRVFAVVRRQSPYLPLDGFHTMKKQASQKTEK